MSVRARMRTSLSLSLSLSLWVIVSVCVCVQVRVAQARTRTDPFTVADNLLISPNIIHLWVCITTTSVSAVLPI